MVHHIHVRAVAKRVHQRGFARIGVADERRRGRALFFASAPVLLTSFFNFGKFLLNVSYSALYVTFVRFEFRFSRTSRAYAAAETRKRFAHALQARQTVLQLRQFDLQFALGRTCALCENIKYQRRSVYHAAVENLFKFAYLRTFEFIVCNGEVDAVIFYKFGYFLCFSASYISCGLLFFAALKRFCGNFYACRVAKSFKFVKRNFRFAVIRVKTYQNRDVFFFILCKIYFSHKFFSPYNNYLYFTTFI